MHTKKGHYGYISAGKKRAVLFTVFCFGVSLALFFMGWYSTGTKKNLLTVVAVLGCLPASKSAVNMIMFLKAKSCPKDVYEKLLPYTDRLTMLFELQITSYEHTFQMDSMVVDSKTICGYTSNSKCKKDAAEKHIKSLFIQNGFKDYTVKIFTNIDKYIERLEQLHKEEHEAHANAEIVNLLLDISL